VFWRRFSSTVHQPKAQFINQKPFQGKLNKKSARRAKTLPHGPSTCSDSHRRKSSRIWDCHGPQPFGRGAMPCGVCTPSAHQLLCKMSGSESCFYEASPSHQKTLSEARRSFSGRKHATLFRQLKCTHSLAPRNHYSHDTIPAKAQPGFESQQPWP